MNPIYRMNRLVFYRCSTNAENDTLGNSDQITISTVHSPDHLPDRFCLDDSIRVQWEGRFHAGHIAIVGALNGIQAHLSWVATHQLYIAELDLHWNLGIDEACIYDCTTLPEYRGKGLYQAALRWIVGNRVTGLNPTTVWVYSDHRNKSSLSGIQMAGFNDVGSAEARFLFGCRITLSTPFDNSFQDPRIP